MRNKIIAFVLILFFPFFQLGHVLSVPLLSQVDVIEQVHAMPPPAVCPQGSFNNAYEQIDPGTVVGYVFSSGEVNAFDVGVIAGTSNEAANGDIEYATLFFDFDLDGVLEYTTNASCAYQNPGGGCTVNLQVDAPSITTTSQVYNGRAHLVYQTATTDPCADLPGTWGDMQDFTVTVQTAPPTDIQLDGATNTSKTENIPAGTQAALISTVDPDFGDTYTYAFESGTGDEDNDKFTIAGDELRIITSPDFESPHDANGDNVYNVRIRTTDPASNTIVRALTLTITDLDEVPPVITRTGPAVVNVLRNTSYTDAGATAMDNLDGDITANIVSTGSVDTTTLGTYTIRYNVSDAAGNAATEVTRTVNVVAGDIPVITRLGSSPLSVNIGSTYSDAGATASDTEDGDISASIVTTGSVNTNTPGTYTIFYNVSDLNGNAATEVTRTVVVEDLTPPSVIINPVTKTSSGSITDTTISITDNIGVNAADISIGSGSSATASSLSCSQTSATQVDCTISVDSSGTLVIDANDTNANSASDSESGYVIDTIPPNIPSVSVNIDAPNDVDNPVVTFSSTDNVAVARYTITYTNASGVVTTQDPVTSPVSLSLDPNEAVHSVTVTAYDTVGNSSSNTVSFPPNVTFSAPTTLSNGDITNSTVTISTPSGNDISNISLTPGSTSASLGTCTGAGGDTTSPYANPVTCTINAIQNSGTISVTAQDSVIGAVGNNSQSYVIDRVLPSVSISAPIKTSSGTITNTTITITDNIGVNAGDVNISSSTAGTSGFSCTQVSALEVQCDVDITSSGDLTVNVSDIAGNSETGSENTYIVDTIAPVIVLNGSGTINVELGSSYTDLGAICSDNVDSSCTIITSGSVNTNTLGTYTISYDATDAVGNNATTVTRTVNVVDTTAPLDATISAPVNGSITTDTTPTLTGTGEANTTFEVRNALGTLLGTGTVDGAGNYSFIPPTALGEGSNTYSVTLVDASGNTSTPVSTNFTIDSIVPLSATITTPANGSFTSDTTPTLTGSGEANTIFEVRNGSGTLLGTGTVDGSGNYSFTPSSPLPEGSNTYEVTLTDAAGNTSSPVNTIFTVDTVAPSSPICTTSPNPANNGTSVTTTCTGVETGVTLTIPNMVCNPTPATSSGTVICTGTVGTNSGDVQVSDDTVTLTDTAGNVNTSVTTGLVIDNVAPDAPVITAPTEGSFTNDNTPTISGTSERDADIVVTIGSNTYTTTADNVGDWTLDISPSLPDGPVSASVTQTDGAGNISTGNTVNFTIDTVNPSTPTINAPSNGSPITGTAEPGTSVTVTTPSGATCTVDPVPASGEYSCTLSPTPVDGEDATVVSIDTAGNTSSATETNAIDISSPLSATILTPANGSFTSDTTPTLTGTGEVNTTFEVRNGSGTLLGTGTVDGSGNYSFTPSSPFPEGSNTYEVTLTDVAGNTSSPVSTVFTVDTGAPATPSCSTSPNPANNGTSVTTTCTGVETGVTLTIPNMACTPSPALANGVVECTGVVGTGVGQVSTADDTVTLTDLSGNTNTSETTGLVIDNSAPSDPTITAPLDGSVTTDTTPTLTGTGEANTTFEVRNAGGTLLGTGTVDGSGNYSFTPSSPLPEGSNTYQVTLVDAAGNTSGTVGTTFTVDSEVPTLSLNGSNPLDIEFGSTYTDLGAQYSDGINGTGSVIGSGTVNTSSLGSYIITYDYTDSAGNTATQITRTVNVVDTTAPVITLFGTGTISVELGSSYSDAGATANDNVDGDLTSSITTNNPVDTSIVGSYTITYNVIDSSGNNATQVNRTVNVVDTTAPVDPTITAPVNGGTTSDTTPTLTGTGEVNTTFEVRNGSGTLLGTGTVDGSGNYNFTPPSPLPEGSNTYSVTLVDDSGNTSSPVSTTFTVDTIAPATPSCITTPNPASNGTSVTTTCTGVEIGTTVTIPNMLCTPSPATSTTVTCTGTVGTASGEVQVSDDIVTVTDTAGNTNTSETTGLIIDNSAPTSPTIIVPANGSITTDTTPTLTGTGEANTTFEVRNGSGILLGTGTVDGSGNYSFTPSSPLPEGSNTYEVTLVDAAGNTSGTVDTTFVVDEAAPIITLIGSGSIDVELGSGYADAGATANDNIQGDITSDIVTVNPVNTSSLGTYTITYNVTDDAGNSAVEVTRTVNVIDTTAPTTPTILTPVNGSITSDNTPNLTGTGEANTIYEVRDGSGTLIGTGTVDALGDYSFTPNSPLPEGSNTYSVILIDDSGNVSSSVSTSFTVDTVTPTLNLNGLNPLDIEFGSTYTDLGAQYSDGINGTGSVIGSGTVNTNALGSYAITYDYTDSAGNAATQITRTVNVVDTTAPIISLNGSGSLTLEKGSSYTDLGAIASDAVDGNTNIVGSGTVNTSTPGTYVITYNTIDSSGNAAIEVTRTVNVVDTVAPLTPTILTPVNGSITSDTTPNLTGTGEANTVYEVRDGSGTLLGTGTVDALGDYSFTPTSPLPEGSNTYSVLLIDDSGNTSTVISTTFTVDTTPALITRNGNEVITLEIGDTYTDAGAVFNDTVDGTGNITALGGPVDTSGTGTYILTYDYTDTAGNVSTQVTRTVNVVDTTPPTISLVGSSTVSIIRNSSYVDSGATANDNLDGDISGAIIVNSNVDTSTVGTYTVTYNVTDASGNAAVQVTRTVQVVIGGTPIITLVGSGSVNVEQNSTYSDAGATASDSEDGNITSSIVINNPVDVTTLGTYTVTYNVTDSSGNFAVEVTRTVNVVDTTAPSIPTISAPVNGSTTTDNTPTLTGTGEANTIFEVRNAGGTLLGTGTLDGSGNYSFTPPSSLPDGSNTYSVVLVDGSGNTSSAATTSFTVDTTAPVMSLNGSSTLSIELGSTYTDQGATANDNVDGNITSSIATSNPVDPNTLGTYTVTYNVTDNAGNIATQIIRTVNVVDTTAPVAPTITVPVNGSFTSDNTPTLTGTGEVNTTFEVRDGSGVLIGTGTVDGSGNYSFTPTTPLPEGSNTYSVVLVDGSGNTSPSVSTIFTVDTTLPDAPVVTSPTNGSSTSDTTPILVGTGEPNADITVTIGTDTYITTVQSNGIWQVSITTALPQGPANFSISQTDETGNASGSTALSIIIDTTDPVAPTIIVPVDGSSTNNNTPTLTGTGEANAIFEVRDGSGSLLGTGTVDAVGNYSFTPTSPLPEGNNTYSINIIDGAGNTSPSSSTSFLIDSIAPAAPTIDGPTSGVPISGTSEPGTTVVVTTPSGATCTATTDSAGMYSCFLSPLPVDGEDVSAVAQDALGNTSIPTTAANAISSLADTDGDGVPDFVESVIGTDPTKQDSDTDGTIDFNNDLDNVSPMVELGAPNGGDGNGDGQVDAVQNEVSSLPNAENSAYNSLSTDTATSCGQITRFDSRREISLASLDNEYDYNLGLWEFEIECSTPGSTANIEIYLDRVYDTSSWQYRKYSNTLDTYTDISSIVTYGTELVGTQNVTVIRYSITDGGVNDEDGIANGVIIDPSGPSTVAANGGGGRTYSCRDINANNYRTFGFSDPSLCTYDPVEEVEEIPEEQEEVPEVQEDTPTEELSEDPVKGEDYTLKNDFSTCPIISNIQDPNYQYSENVFSDISLSRKRAEILKFAQIGIIDGYDDGTFGPLLQMTRTEFLKVALISHCYNYRNEDPNSIEYTDVDTTSWQAKVIVKAESLGMINGDVNDRGEKVFRPNDIISKAEAVKILMRLSFIEANDPVPLTYTDITVPWHEKYIQTGEALGLFNAESDFGKFYPDGGVYRENMIDLINRLVQLYK